MGLFDDYNVDMEDVKETSWEIPDDFYEFIIGSCWIQEGTKKDPDAQYFVIEYLLGDEGELKKSEWFGLPLDPTSPTDKELQKLGFLKTRMKSLFPDHSDAELNAVEEDDLIGLSGTLQVATRNGFQNVKNVRVASAEEESEGAQEGPGNPARTIVEDEAPAKAAPARKAAPAKATAPSPKEKAAAKGAVANPFAR